MQIWIKTFLIGVSNGIKVRHCDRDPTGYCQATHGLESRALDDDNDKWRTYDGKIWAAVDPSTSQAGEELYGYAPSENHFLRGIGVTLDPYIKNLVGIFVDVTDGTEQDVVVKETDATLEITRLECDPG